MNDYNDKYLNSDENNSDINNNEGKKLKSHKDSSEWEPTLEEILFPLLFNEQDDLLYFVIGVGSITGLVYGCITIGLLIQYARLRNKYFKIKKEKVVRGKYK